MMNCPNCKYFASCSGKYKCHYEKRSEVKEMLKDIDKVIEDYYTDNPDWERIKIGGNMSNLRCIKIGFKAVFLQHLLLAIYKYLYDFKNITDSKVSIIIWICCFIYCIIDEYSKDKED